MREVRLTKGSPLGVDLHLDDEVAMIEFVLEDGHHLHIQIAQSQLETLSRHIEIAIDQMRAAKRRRS